MGRRAAARRRARGGEGIPASRSAGPRVAAATAALLLLGVGAVTLPFRLDDPLAPLVGTVGGAAALLLVVALAARSSALLPWALALAGAEYAAFLVVREGTVDAAAPVYAAGLLVVAELGYWALERSVPSEGEGLVARRLSLIAAATLAAGGIGGLILTVAELSISGGLGLELLGVAAAVGVLAVVGALARRV